MPRSASAPSVARGTHIQRPPNMIQSWWTGGCCGVAGKLTAVDDARIVAEARGGDWVEDKAGYRVKYAKARCSPHCPEQENRLRVSANQLFVSSNNVFGPAVAVAASLGM